MDQRQARMRVATWNVHRGVGMDGRYDPDRILGVIAKDIAPRQPDILVLQEADEDVWPHRGFLDLDGIEAATGLRHAHGPGLLWGPDSHGFLGVIVFLRNGLLVRQGRVLDLPGHAHRGAVVLDFELPLRLVATHLSLAQWLRAVQMRAVGQYLHRAPEMDTLLVGDLNEWRPWAGLAFSKPVTGRRLSGPAAATFPVGRPVLPLDRIMGDRPGMVETAEVLDSPAIRLASDHRPLMADVRLDLS